MLQHHWSHPTSPAGAGWDIVISNRVRLVTETGFSARAAVGEADVIRVVVDDPNAEYDFKTLHRWYLVETACPSGNQLVWNGYIGDQRIIRGSDGILYPTGSGRVWELELVQENTILGLRIVTGADGNRPAETAKARLTWLLASDYLSTVHDHGLIDWTGLDTFAMDAVDYRGQTAADVLRDISLISNYNHYARYNETYQEIELACYEPNTSTLDTSSLAISNAAADIDLATTWPPSEDTVVTRQGSRVAAGIYLPYDGGSVYTYSYDTSYTFGFRDVAAPSANVKTETKAKALAARLLAQHATQDERVTTRIQVPAANLGDVKHGQLIDSVKLVHAPGSWMTGRPARVVSKSFGRPGNLTQAVYDVDLELSPAAGAPSHASTAQINNNAALVTLPKAPGEGMLMVMVLNRAINSDDPWGPTFTDGGSNVRTWTYLDRAWALDPTQYGGPGPGAQVAVWYRFAGANEGNLVGIVNWGTSGALGATVITFALGQTPTVTTKISDTLYAGNWTIGGATSGYWLATMALQRTAYAPADVITTTAGHEIANFDPAQNPYNDSWHYVAWNYAADVKGTIAVNPNLNKWGRAALGITIPAAVL